MRAAFEIPTGEDQLGSSEYGPMLRAEFQDGCTDLWSLGKGNN